MKPIKTETSNLVYHGPTPEIGDLWCRRDRPGRIVSVWEFDAEERQAIAEGANVELVVLTEPIPPVALAVTAERGEPYSHKVEDQKP